MKFSPLSAKAEEALLFSDHRINFFIGAVRSSKTFVSVLTWINFITTCVKKDQLLAICGKSIATIERNLISEIKKIIGHENVIYKPNKAELYIYGFKHMVVGVNDEGAAAKIQGSTLVGALCDEVVLYPKSFIDMLLTRMSEDGSRMIWTANPAGSNHYMKTDYIDCEEEMNREYGGKQIKVFTFTIDDNLSLSEDYKRSLKVALKGVYYKRLVSNCPSCW